MRRTEEDESENEEAEEERLRMDTARKEEEAVGCLETALEMEVKKEVEGEEEE